jgi:RimJ/RimL family protein N-acetyltransferase
MARLPQLAQALDDGRVRLRDAAERDIPDVLSAFEDDPQLHLRLGQDRPPSGAQLGRLLEAEHADRAAGSRATLTILTGPDDVCRGQVTVHHLDWDHGRAELSIWVAPELRGQGIGAAALRLAADWLLRECGVPRVQLVAERDNQALLGAAHAAGFTEEGVLHGYLRVRGRRLDVVMLSRLAEEAP